MLNGFIRAYRILYVEMAMRKEKAFAEVKMEEKNSAPVRSLAMNDYTT